jgi:hypothetical protein
MTSQTAGGLSFRDASLSLRKRPRVRLRLANDRGKASVTLNRRDPGTGTSTSSSAAETRAFGRDRGPISARNTSKGAILRETQAVFQALGQGLPLTDIRNACLQGTILRQRARATRQHIWNSVNWRYFAWNPPQWVLRDLETAANDWPSSSTFPNLAYIHYARRDRLTFEFVTVRLWDQAGTGISRISREDVLDFLAAKEEEEPHIRRWRESTRKKLARNLLSALRDFGVLSGSQKKLLSRPSVPLEVACHLCRLLYWEGLRGRRLLEAPDWRLFFWHFPDTAHALGQLARMGKVRFEQAGRTIVLEVPGISA